MTQIVTEHGTFQADTLADATRLAKKAAAAAARSEKARRALRKIATLVAAQNAYQIHEKLAEIAAGVADILPRGWWLARPGQANRGVKVESLPHGRGHAVVYDGVRCEHYGFNVEAVLFNGAGFATAVWLSDALGDTSRVEAYAIGTHEGVLELVPLTVDLARVDAYLRRD